MSILQLHSFSDYFGSPGSLEMPCKLEDQLLIFCKEANRDTDKGCVESVDQVGEYCPLIVFKSSNPSHLGIASFQLWYFSTLEFPFGSFLQFSGLGSICFSIGFTSIFPITIHYNLNYF